MKHAVLLTLMFTVMVFALALALKAQTPEQKPAPAERAQTQTIPAAIPAALEAPTLEEERELSRNLINMLAAQIASMRALAESRFGWDLQKIEQDALARYNAVLGQLKVKYKVPNTCEGGSYRWDYFRSMWDCQKEPAK